MPISHLLDLITEVVDFFEHERGLRIFRIGGVGDRIWALERRIDCGEERIELTLKQLQSLLRDETQCIEELHCEYNDLIFGLSDSSFLFLQAGDKRIETHISSGFRDVTNVDDRPLR